MLLNFLKDIWMRFLRWYYVTPGPVQFALGYIHAYLSVIAYIAIYGAEGAKNQIAP